MGDFLSGHGGAFRPALASSRHRGRRGRFHHQQPSGSVLLLEFLAPAFDFRVVENLAEDAAEQALQIRFSRSRRQRMASSL